MSAGRCISMYVSDYMGDRWFHRSGSLDFDLLPNSVDSHAHIGAIEPSDTSLELFGSILVK